MPREIVTVSVGQCGLQLGARFWELALLEHQQAQAGQVKSQATKQAFSLPQLHDDPATTFFDVTDDGQLNARAVLIDTELGVLSSIARSSHAGLFDESTNVTEVSGAGNNFAHGHYIYGPQLIDMFSSAIHRVVERCDSLQSFMLLHSTGGGTGSGLGTFVLDWLADEYPSIYRMDNCILPSAMDDVVTSPYNATLALERIIQSADAAMPCDNQALIDICQRYVDQNQPVAKPSVNSKRTVGGGFRDLNLLCASVLSSLTAGMRFGGELNVDLNDLIMNLIPMPEFKFLLPALTPIQTIFRQQKPSNSKVPVKPLPPRAPPVPHPTQLFHTVAMAKQCSTAHLASAANGLSVPSNTHNPSPALTNTLSKGSSAHLRSIDSTFHSVLAKSNQLIQCDPSKGVYLTSALLCRGDLSSGLLQRQVSLLTPHMNFAASTQSTFKLGLCSQPSVDSPFTVLGLSNTTSISQRLDSLTDRARVLFGRRAHFHHYTDCGLEEQQMLDALETVRSVSDAYKGV